MQRRSRWLMNVTLVLVVMSALYFPTIRGIGASDWPQFQIDAVRSGLTADSAPTSYPVCKWVRYTWSSGSMGLESPPVIAGEMIYVHAGNGLWAFDCVTGENEWHQTVPGSSTLQTSAPACGDGKVFIATTDGYIRAYDALLGTPLWEAGISETLFQCPITYHDQRIYIGQGGTGGDSNSYFCLDMAGNVVWEYPASTAGYLWSGASVIGNYLVFANHEAVLTSLNRTSGTLVDQLSLDAIIQGDAGMARASVTYHNGFVYTTSESGISSGYIWKIGYNPVTGDFDGESGWNNSIGFSTSTPVVYQGKVYVGEGEHGQDGSLICLDDQTGIINWICPVEGGIKSSPVLSVEKDGGYLYFHTSMDNGYIYCVKDDGTLCWKWNPPDDDAYILQGVAVSDGMVYLGTCSGKLYALGSENGWTQFQRNALNCGTTFDVAPRSLPDIGWKSFTVYWSTHGIDVTPIVVNGKVIVVDCREKVWAFDVHTGAEVWSTQLVEGDRYTIGTPAAGEDKIFCATDGGYIYALEEATGGILWSGKLTTGVNQEEELNTQVTYVNGKIYVGSWEGVYYCLDAGGDGSSPEIEWTYHVSNTRYDWYSAAAVIGDYVIFGNTDGILLCLDAGTGTPVSSMNLSDSYSISAGSVRSGISVNTAQDRIYLSSTAGYVYSIGFDGLSGEFDTGDGWFAGIDSYSQSTPVYFDGKVYVSSGDFTKPGALYCFDDATATQEWRYAFGSYGSTGSPALSIQDGLPYVYITTNDAHDNGGAYCFSATGALLWEYIPDPEYNEMMLQGVALAEGKVLFGNDAGWLYALEDSSIHSYYDVNLDGHVDLFDLVHIALHMGETGLEGWIREDVDYSGVIDIFDLVSVAWHLGE